MLDVSSGFVAGFSPWSALVNDLTGSSVRSVAVVDVSWDSRCGLMSCFLMVPVSSGFPAGSTGSKPSLPIVTVSSELACAIE